MKRTELRRGKPMARTRKALPARSPKRIAATDERARVREAVFARDGWRCRLSTDVDGYDDHAGVTFHHLRKEGQGGAYTEENGIALCGRCNLWVEDEPLEAWRVGLVQRAGDTAKDVWRRLHRHGLAASPEPGSPPLKLSYGVRRGDQEASPRFDHPDGSTASVPDVRRLRRPALEGGAP